MKIDHDKEKMFQDLDDQYERKADPRKFMTFRQKLKHDGKEAAFVYFVALPIMAISGVVGKEIGDRFIVHGFGWVVVIAIVIGMFYMKRRIGE